MLHYRNGKKIEIDLDEYMGMASPRGAEYLDELAAKYNIPDNVILEIGVTFVVNEMSAAMSHNPCIINSIMPCVDVNPTNQNEDSD